MSDIISNVQRPTNVVDKTAESFDSWLPMLPQLSDAPWSLNDVSRVLRLGRARQYCRSVSPQTVERVCSLIQRPFLRIVYEAERLSHRYERCTKTELQSSIRLVLSPSLAKACLQVASKAFLLYTSTTERFYDSSKRIRSGLTFPVGRFFGWLVNAKVAQRVYDSAAIYLAATLEYIAEETVFRAVVRIKGTVDHMTPDMVEDVINSDPDLWCLFQPYVHLLSGRTSFGLIDTLDVYAIQNQASPKREGKPNSTKALETCFITTCVSTLAELRELVTRVQQRFSQLKQCKENRALSQLAWLPIAMETLFYFMNCVHNKDGNNNTEVLLTSKKSHHSLPPLTEWLRVVCVHAEHRLSGFVDDDDVRQAARLLLPFNNCSYRILGPDNIPIISTSSDFEDFFTINLGLRMLLSGEHGKSTMSHIGGKKGNSIDQRGMTPLMYACSQGEPSLVRLLLDSHVLLDTQVSRDSKKYPLVDPDVFSWTALSFAVSKGYLHICQLLLDVGANVNGNADVTSGVETPLQLAVVAGNYDIVSLLCARGANINVTFPLGVGRLGFSNTFAAAAALGHRRILRKLLAEAPSAQDDAEMMSLAEILAEGSSTNQRKSKKLSKKRCRALQEAIYHSCEHGYLDVAMEIRSLGVPWNLHCWSQALYHAYHTNMTSSMTSQMRCLLRDFQSISKREYTAEFCDDGLILLFTIFRECQEATLSVELASVFSFCFGDEPLPKITELPSATPAIKIGVNYVNNREMSDVTFLVEDQPFYGHKIILASASIAFKDVLSANEKVPCIKIPELKYDVFTLMMRYVYTGRTDKIVAQQRKVLELLHAATVFKLDGLQRHCELLLANQLDNTNIIATYKIAKKYEATSLVLLCECYILSNMKEITKSGELRTLILSEDGPEVLKCLQLCLSSRIKATATKS